MLYHDIYLELFDNITDKKKPNYHKYTSFQKWMLRHRLLLNHNKPGRSYARAHVIFKLKPQWASSWSLGKQKLELCEIEHEQNYKKSEFKQESGWIRGNKAAITFYKGFLSKTRIKPQHFQIYVTNNAASNLNNGEMEFQIMQWVGDIPR